MTDFSLTRIDVVVLDRYFAGELLPEEAQCVAQVLESDPALRELVATMKWLSAGPYQVDVGDDTEVRLEAVMGREMPGISVRMPESKVPRRKGNVGVRLLEQRVDKGGGLGQHTLRKRLVYCAAAVCIVVGLSTLGLRGKHQESQRDHPTTYLTRAGQQAIVMLGDGSRALLGPATTVSVTPKFSGRDIDVQVNGQAVFTVAHRSRLFRVWAGHGRAEVLGTTFLVRRYESDTIARIVVAEGRVSLRGTQRSTASSPVYVLGARDIGVVNDSGQVRVLPNVSVEDYTAWATGKLVFHRTPVRDIVMEVGRAYGVDLRVTDPALAARSLTWTVPISQRSLSGVLGTLTVLLDAHAVRAGQVITLVPGSLAHEAPRGSHPSTTSSEVQYGR